MSLAEELKARGYAEQSSTPLETILESKRGVYLGIDPTADSLHVGHLVPLMLMKRLAQAGHRTVFLVGGGTGMIGDPRDSGERQLLDKRTLEHNKRALRSQLQKVVGRRIELVDNASWLGKTGLLEFLRDIGKHFTVNELIKRDLIKRRLDTPDESISFTEFSYSLLQGFDFLTLFKKKAVAVQVGASDQWTNMLSGVELIRRKLAQEAFCFTCPLITDAQGKKFGKSEGNAVWLDAKKTSPFAFYQFWINLPDQGLDTYLKVYTFLSITEINALMELHTRNPNERQAQMTLARIVTETVHGPAAAAQAAAATEALFGTRPLSELKKEDLAVIRAEVPSGLYLSNIQSTAVAGNFVSSNSEFKRLVESKGLSINNKPVTDVNQQISEHEFIDGVAILKKGKKGVFLIKRK